MFSLFRGQSTLVGPIARGWSRFPAQGEFGGKEAMAPHIISKSAVIKRDREDRNRILFSALNTEKRRLMSSLLFNSHYLHCFKWHL
ncbi:unnamed protein product [Arctogadus glacialis]